MDFKVTGTEKGVTAIQVDIKIKGLTLDLVKEAVERAREARLKILGAMSKVISKPRNKVSQYAPKVATLHIPQEVIGTLIGPGGKTIRRITEETEATVDVDDDGVVSITGLTENSVATAIEKIKALTHQVTVGEEFEGTVKRVEPFGAFVEFLPGKEGLVHVSRMGKGFIKSALGVLEIGQKVKVKVVEIDSSGRVKLSLLFPVIEGESRPSQPRFQSPFSSPRRGYKRKF